jgi:BirA family transcriptional regulator, biotin operon repressor / biotin---[acetyl-CoA-carboxylase] ligase
VVAASPQTKGRGRKGRMWWSQPGGSLLFSIVLRPNRPAAELDLLSTAVGLACARAIEAKARLPLELKWPNDLVVGERKLGGILVETRAEGENVPVAVLGIGINLSRAPTGSDAGAARATNLAAELDAAALRPAPDRVTLLASIVAEFERLYPGLEPATIVPEATERSAVLGRRVRVVRVHDTSIEGRAVSLLPNGALEVDVGGHSVAVASGDVTTLLY